MAKVRTTITINKNLLKKAKEHSIRISSFLDIELRRYIAFIEGKQTNYPQINEQSNERSIKKEIECGRRESNPGSELGRLKS